MSWTKKTVLPSAPSLEFCGTKTPDTVSPLVLFTSYLLFALAGESNATILRTVIHASRIQMYEVMTFACVIFIIVAIAIRNYIACTGVSRIVTAVSGLILVWLIAMYSNSRVLSKMFPVSSIHWTPVTGVHASKKAKADSKRLSGIKLQEIAAIHGRAIVEEVIGQGGGAGNGESLLDFEVEDDEKKT